MRKRNLCLDGRDGDSRFVSAGFGGSDCMGDETRKQRSGLLMKVELYNNL